MTTRLSTLKKFIASAFMASLMLATSIASAQDYFGSIYFSPATGVDGFSFDYGTQREAQQRALNECINAGGTDCVEATWFRNSCGALAVGNNNGWGSHWGNNRNGAEHNAMRTCKQNARGCAIVRWVCTAGASN